MLSSMLVILAETLLLASPYLLAAMGGWASERSGVMNIGLEGKMLTAACVAAWVGTVTQNAWLGAGAGIVAATLMSLLHWLMTQTYRLDHIISGMAINFLAAGATGFIAVKYLTSLSDRLPLLPVFQIQLTPNYLFRPSLLAILSILIPILLAFYVLKTRAGLRLLAVGNDPDKSRLMGVQPLKVRLGALIATGVFTGLAGVQIVMGAGQFTENMTAGRGYIALAALILGAWKPLPTLGAALVFALFEALQKVYQGVPVFGLDIPSEFWQALPYVVTVIALAGFLGRSRAPQGLGKP